MRAAHEQLRLRASGCEVLVDARRSGNSAGRQQAWWVGRAAVAFRRGKRQLKRRAGGGKPRSGGESAHTTTTGKKAHKVGASAGRRAIMRGFFNSTASTLGVAGEVRGTTAGGGGLGGGSMRGQGEPSSSPSQERSQGSRGKEGSFHAPRKTA